MAIVKIEVQDSTGEIYYPHSSSDVVKHGTNSTVAKELAKTVTFSYGIPREYPMIATDGSDWIQVPKGGIVPPKSEEAYVGIPGRPFYDIHSQFLNAKHIGGNNNNRRWDIIPVVGDDGVMEIGRIIDFHDKKASISDYTYRLQNEGSVLFYSGTISQMSDREVKENIEYLEDKYLKTKMKRESFSDFIRNFKFATYNYKGAEETNFGFIAQDIEYSDIGKYMLREFTIYNFNPETGEKLDERECLAFDVTAYTSVVAKALQEEIKLRDKQIESLEEKIKLLEKKIDMLVA